jgi:phage FluMu protein Com
MSAILPKQIKSYALWRAFYFAFFVGTLLPVVVALCTFDLYKSIFSSISVVLAGAWSLLLFTCATYMLLYCFAILYLYWRYRCPCCKAVWSFTLPREAAAINAAKRVYQCLACGHRDF